LRDLELVQKTALSAKKN